MDNEGKPQAGFRMDIPDFLGGDHKVLNDYGFRMKRIHSKETRKNIKFDEAAYSLVLELKLPGDDSWIKITPALAKELRQEYESQDIRRLRDKLTARPVPAPSVSANWVPLGQRTLTTKNNGERLVPPRRGADQLYPNKGIPGPPQSSVLAPPILRSPQDPQPRPQQTWRPPPK